MSRPKQVQWDDVDDLFTTSANDLAARLGVTRASVYKARRIRLAAVTPSLVAARDDRSARVRASMRFALALVLAFVALVLWASVLVRGQRAPTDVEQLARIAVHETGWEDTGDASAIYAVLVAGGEREGITWQAYARRYSRRLHRGEVRRLWAAELTEDCARPAHWPRTVTVRQPDGSLVVRPHPWWSAYVNRCEAVMVRTREVLSGERTHGCERTPHDWGGVVDRERARRLGLILIDCSRGDVETVGDYYVRPSLMGGGR